jgi:hypothetical protein
MEWFGRDRSAFQIGQFTSLLVDRQHDIRFNIRGLRAAQDFNYEFEMHGINCDIAPEINTVFLVAPPEFQFISSSTIKLSLAHRRQVRGAVRGERPARREPVARPRGLDGSGSRTVGRRVGNSDELGWISIVSPHRNSTPQEP